MKQVLYRVYLFLIFSPIFFFTTVFAAVFTAVGSILGGTRFFSYYPGKLWSRITLAMLFCPVKVVGREHIPKSQACIVTPNHSSALDIFVLYGYMGRHFKWVMKGSLRKLPFVGWACEKSGFMFVDNTLEGAKSVTEAAKTALANDYFIFIFPEGTRTHTGTLGKLKRGAFKIAQDTKAPILPVTIRGAFEALPRTETIPKPRRITIQIHPPLYPTEYGDDPRALITMAQDVRDILVR